MDETASFTHVITQVRMHCDL